MRSRIIVVVILLIAFHGTSASAACKPDFSSQDKISKEPIVKWFHNLTEAGFWKSMVVTDIDIVAIIGRYGDMNALTIQIVNKENDRDRATFDSRYRARSGDSIVFGFKDAKPLTFVATEVNNQAQILETKGLVMTVVLSAALTDGELAKFRTELTTNQIDAVRIGLSSGMIERSIEEEHGQAMMQKFSCFYEYLDGHGSRLSASADHTPQERVPANDPIRMAAIQGRYARKGTPTDFIELNADGTASLRQDDRTMRGRYTVQGDTISVTSPEMPGQINHAHITGETIKDDEGIIWEKLTEEQRAAAAPLPKEAEPSQDVAASVVGKYVAKGVAYYLELKADGTISCGHFDGSPAREACGTYKLSGPGVTLSVSNNKPVNLLIKGNSLVGKTQVWEKQVEAPRVEMPRASTAPVTIRLGMTPQQVEEALGGKPQKVIDLGSKKLFVYSDMKITFIDGKVTDVQ